MLLELNKDTLTFKAYKNIKNDIMTAKIKPGELVSEIQISEKLSMSRTPVREAIKRLETEGLVRSIADRGTIVTKLTSKDIKDIFFLRITLETAALEISLENITYNDICDLEEDFEKIASKLPNIEEETKIELFNLDKKLHNLIIKKSYNSKLIKFVDILHSQIELIRGISAVMPGRLNKSFNEHREILKSIKKNDKNMAKKLLREHLTNIKNNTLKINESLEKYI